MDGETKLMVIVYCLFALCITVLYSFLFIALWAYKEWVGGSLIILGILFAIVYLKGRLTEQELRHMRYRHHEETPLDEAGEPVYWHSGTQQNPHRIAPPSYGRYD